MKKRNAKMKKIMNRLLLSVVVSVVTSLTATSAPVSTPYTNTFNTEASTNDFFQGFSGVAERVGDQYWKWSNGTHLNYIYSGRGLANQYAWATVNFGGDPEAKRTFSIKADMQAKANDSGTNGYLTAYSWQGLCALASNERLTTNTYYYGRVYFTNSVGTIQISKFDGGLETVLTNAQASIKFVRFGRFSMKLEGTYVSPAARNLSLTYSIWNASETNTVSTVDGDPLTGTWFGYRDFVVRDGMTVAWDNLVVEVELVPEAGTVLVVK